MFFYILLGILLFLLAFALGYFYLYLHIHNKIILDQKDLDIIIKNEREDAKKRSKAVLGGLFSEQLAPFLPNFPFNPNDVRFIGKPIDYIVFKGISEENIKEIIFLEIKSGNSKLNKIEKNLKQVIEQKKVKWQQYNISKELTK